VWFGLGSHRPKTPRETTTQLIDWFRTALLARTSGEVIAQALYPNRPAAPDFDAHLQRQSELYGG